MLTENRTAQAEAEIRALLENWKNAFLKRDVNAVMALYAPDVVAFDAILKLQFKGVEAYGKHWEACMAMCDGELVFEVRELTITAAEEIAFGHYLCRCGATNDQGETQSSWMRVSFGLRRHAEGWRIVHEHFSAPFDPASGKALFDAQP
ncbi:MAG TPA: SgcJ/EcaC family oxidoreductase [Noviherbaspirillum sp.]